LLEAGFLGTETSRSLKEAMKPPAKILIVDDNPVVLFSVTHLLKTAGFTVLQAENGQQCLLLARAELPDLVLLDVLLPDVNGIDLCRQIKSEPEISQLFVVLLSSFETSPESKASGLEAGADGYIARPIENRELLARVQALLRIKQAESALRKAHHELEMRVEERTGELSRANAALKTLSLRLVEVQESERRYIARELHDEIGQMLTGLKLILETSFHPTNTAQEQTLSEAISLVHDTMEQVRKLSIDLRPQMLDDLGLLPALNWHFKRYSRQTGIEVSFRHTLLAERLSSLLETAIFRIAQEALTNVARHAGVKEVIVRLAQNTEGVGLEIEDHGKGFSPERALERRSSTGLIGMKERAELLGGHYILKSAPGQGTRLMVTLPLHDPLNRPGGNRL
jgi:signal transduction histidine kinase